MNCLISRCICKTSDISCFLLTPYKTAHKSTEVVSQVLYLNVLIRMCFILCKTNAPYLTDEVLINMSPYVYDTEDAMALHIATKWGRQALSRLSDMSCSWYYENLPLFLSISLCGKRQTHTHIFSLKCCLSVFVCVCVSALTQCECQQNQSNWRLGIQADL